MLPIHLPIIIISFLFIYYIFPMFVLNIVWLPVSCPSTRRYVNDLSHFYSMTSCLIICSTTPLTPPTLSHIICICSTPHDKNKALKVANKYFTLQERWRHFLLFQPKTQANKDLFTTLACYTRCSNSRPLSLSLAPSFLVNRGATFLWFGAWRRLQIS